MGGGGGGGGGVQGVHPPFKIPGSAHVVAQNYIDTFTARMLSL